MSTHFATVVHVDLFKHPNAEKLALCYPEGFCLGTNAASWGVDPAALPMKDSGEPAVRAKALGVFIPPDSLVPVVRPEFEFLAGAAYKEPHPYQGFARITVKRFRGLFSKGLLVESPPGLAVGDNAFDALGLMHWEPVNSPDTRLDGESDGTDDFGSKYDLEPMQRFSGAFKAGELVHATEKIHGCNARFKYDMAQERFRCGSRSSWKKHDGVNVWIKVLTQDMPLQTLCRENPHLVVFGEVFGAVQKFTYGHEKGSVDFVCFDIFDSAQRMWLNHAEIVRVAALYSLPVVPLVYSGPFDLDKLKDLAEGPSLLSPAGVPCREGVVVRPDQERQDPMVNGRVVLKLVGSGYYEATGKE